MEKLKNALSFGGILPKERIKYVLDHFEKSTIKINDHFLNVGKISNRIGFIDNGILRCYALGKDGSEVTKYFVRQNQFVVDLESYYNVKPCDTGIQAVIDSTLFTIGKNTWERLMEEEPKLYIFTKSLTEASLLNKIKDNDFLNFGTSMSKYQEFLKRYPDIALQVPQRFIASYLKITPQSLSRIRKALVK